ncbi:uncharacterized protein LOC100741867 isoform X3 [Bombus impatiens]|uniref:Uncharacterized protein LOC100741867 isoform X3 n=1 Tax=Bombus impatiens TaxID=132113 RepID=A0A6P8LYS4_BOMIM|nr:uncharacterized protein LOC100741867 isoform X3 [Bombus impatiens]
MVSAVVNLLALTEHHPMDSVETEVQVPEDHPAVTEHLVEEMVSVVVNLPALTVHRPMDSVETEVQVPEDHPAATEHLVGEMVSVVVSLLVLMVHRPMDSVETEVQEPEDRPVVTEHLAEEMVSVVEATELARTDSAVLHRTATVLQKTEMVLVVAMEVDLHRVSMDLLEETVETAGTVETVAMEDGHRVVTERLREMEEDHRVFMDHQVEMEITAAEMEDITVAMVDIHQEDRVVTGVAMVDILLEVLVAMMAILLEVPVVMAAATVVILLDQVEMVAVTEVTGKMKITNQQSTNSLMKSRTSSPELIMAIRKAETGIAHRESSMFCFLMAENKSLSTKLIKMDLNLKLDTKVKRMAKDMVLVDQEAMVEIMDTQVADLTEMEPEGIRREDQVVTMAVTETEITVATVATVATVETMEDIHPEVVATQRLTEDINTKCSSKCSNIYRVYYKRGIHRATFIITHGIVSVWNSKNATVIVSDDNFSTIEF